MEKNNYRLLARVVWIVSCVTGIFVVLPWVDYKIILLLSGNSEFSLFSAIILWFLQGIAIACVLNDKE